MEWDLPIAVLCGSAVGLVTFGVLVPDWFVALGTATVYAGAAYLSLAFDVSLGDEIRFEARMDRLGYAIGLFGLSVSPLAFAAHFGGDDAATVAFVLWFSGVVAFLTFASKARRQERRG